MAGEAGGTAAVFDGIILNKTVNNKTNRKEFLKNALPIKIVEEVDEATLKVNVAKDLYMASDFTNNPNKSARQFAREACDRANAFLTELKSRGMV